MISLWLTADFSLSQAIKHCLCRRSPWYRTNPTKSPRRLESPKTLGRRRYTGAVVLPQARRHLVLAIATVHIDAISRFIVSAYLIA